MFFQLVSMSPPKRRHHPETGHDYAAHVKLLKRQTDERPPGLEDGEPFMSSGSIIARAGGMSRRSGLVGLDIVDRVLDGA